MDALNKPGVLFGDDLPDRARINLTPGVQLYRNLDIIISEILSHPAYRKYEIILTIANWVHGPESRDEPLPLINTYKGKRYDCRDILEGGPVVTRDYSENGFRIFYPSLTTDNKKTSYGFEALRSENCQNLIKYLEFKEPKHKNFDLKELMALTQRKNLSFYDLLIHKTKFSDTRYSPATVLLLKEKSNENNDPDAILTRDYNKGPYGLYLKGNFEFMK